MATVLCLDTEPSTSEELSRAGHNVHSAETGIRTGFRNFLIPPHEVDLIVCDLKKPACFDALHWGPGKNDNYQCAIVKDPTDQIYYRDGMICPRFPIIQESQLDRRSLPTTFGPADVLKAVDKAGVPVLLFLNSEWLRHVSVTSPNIVGFIWQFGRTAAAKVEIGAPLAETFPELGRTIGFKLPLEFAIEDGPVLSRSSRGIPSYQAAAVVTNAVGQVFGQVIQMTKGCIWALPGCQDNVQLIKVFVSRAAELRKVSFVGRRPTPDPTRGLGSSDDSRDVFISYASEDRETVARPLAELLRREVTVWYDEYELTLGDSLRRKIEEGLKMSRFGVTILSHSFFQKNWPQRELDGLFALETGSKKILPVWHGLGVEEIRRYSPILADRLGISTSQGLEKVFAEILRAVRKP